MYQEMIKFDENNAQSLENSTHVKEEFQDVYYPDNKVCISETTITDNINNNELNGYIKNDKIKYETLSVDHIKTDLPSSEVNDAASNNVKIENGISLADIKIEFCSELLFCTHCHDVYQDYCAKCRVLVHILNKRPSHNTYNRVKELPIYMLEIKESYGYLGIFSLKVIPENVKFGPFTGLNSTGLPLRIKGGRFVIGDDQLEQLNWMQYINPARNIYEQNLLPFQYEGKLYYCSTRRIQEGEELLVYFGEKYENNLLENIEMDFVPITKEDVENVFACTFCCLGFSSKEYLAEHKAVFHSETDKIFSLEELVQCAFCKIYLEAKEYFEHHMDYCCETNAGYCILREVHKREVETRSSPKRRNRGIFKCAQCKFRTMYNADFRRHTNDHSKVKVYKCGICHRRYKTKESLKAHVEKIHIDNEGRDVQTYSTCSYSKANIKNTKERSSYSHHGEKQCQSSKSKSQTRHKCHLKSVNMKIKHLKLCDYKCMECEYQTNLKSNLKRHMKAEHLKLRNYKCAMCEYQARFKSSLEGHIKTKHLKIGDYKCMECEYQTNVKSNLELHIKSKHLKLHDYKCVECEYETNLKSNLDRHVKTKHLKLRDYKCMKCEYKTSRKSNLELHIKTKHLKLHDYKCMECEYRSNSRSNFKLHVKSKHLKMHDYKCMDCEYETNVKSHLKTHVKTKHLKLRDYKCMECEYKANRKCNLAQHIKSKHLKLRDYKCEECKYQTSLKSSLKRHIRRKHLKAAVSQT